MYEPNEQARGGCMEALLLTWIAFRVLVPVLFALIAVIGVVVLEFALLAQHPALALIPVGVAAAGLYAMYRRERSHDRTMEELEDRYRGGDG